VVHRARDTVIGREVALKIISFDPDLSEDERHELAQRSEREARAAGALNHPNIVTLHDAGRSPDDTSFFIVMEYVEGPTLRQRLSQGPLPVAAAAVIARQVAGALQYAHERGIVHRDVKPANILLRADGVAKLVDFGIARTESSEITRSGQSMGSPAYMSPEQALGRPVDARSDIFSLGIVLYQMLAGRRPFEGETLASVSVQIVSEAPAPPSRWNESIPAEWDALILKAIAKKPQDRFESAAAMALEMERLDPGAPPAEGGAAPAGAAHSTAPTGSAATRNSRTPTLEPLPEAHPIEDERPRRTIPLAVAAVIALALVAYGGFRLYQYLTPKAAVAVEFTHGLKSGEIEIQVDGESLWRQTIQGSDAGAFKRFARRLSGKGADQIATSLMLPEGDHLFAVTVVSGDDRWSESTKRRLAASRGETLSIRVRAGVGRGMELDWK